MLRKKISERQKEELLIKQENLKEEEILQEKTEIDSLEKGDIEVKEETEEKAIPKQQYVLVSALAEYYAGGLF